MDAASPLVPGWLARAASAGWRVLATIGLVVVVLVVAYQIPVSTTATLVSLVFAAALAPTALRLRDRGLPRTVAAAITFGVGAALLVGTAIVLLVVLVPDLVEIAAAVQQGLEQFRARLAELGASGALSELVDRVADAIVAALKPDLTGLAGSIADIGTVLVLGTFLTFFLLADGDSGWGWLMRQLRPWQVVAVTSSARTGLDRVAWYVRRTALLAALDAVVVWVVLMAFGTPLAGALASVAFVAGFVPYLGAIAGGTVVFLASLALGGPVAAIAVVAALLGSWLVASRLLRGTAMGRDTDVNPILVLVAIPAGLALFGILGLVALLPVTVFALAVWRSVVAALDLAPSGGLDLTPDDPPEPAPDLPDGVPLWLDRVAQWSWRALVLAALAWLIIALVVRLSSVVVPAVIAVVAAATLLPVVALLVRRGWGRGVAAAVSTVGVTAIVAAASIVAVVMTLGPLAEVIDAAAAGAAGLDLGWLRDALVEAGTGLGADLAAMFFSLAGVALGLLLALLMTYFLLRDGPTWWAGGVARLSPGRRGPVGEVGRRAVEVLAGYMIGTAAISAFGGLTSWLVMVVLGLPLGFPIAVIGFFAGFIPYIGSFITTGLALLVTVALGEPSDIVWMLVFTVVFNIAQGNFVTPLVYGKSLSLHPAIVLMAIPVGNEIAGILGMFLVVPAAAMVAATWRLLPAVIDASGVPPGPAEEGPEEGPEAAGPEAAGPAAAGPAAVPGAGAADPASAGT